MSKSKYNIGDKVLVRGGLCSEVCYDGVYFSKSMKGYRSKVVTIDGCFKTDSGSIHYKTASWFWSEEMFVKK